MSIFQPYSEEEFDRIVRQYLPMFHSMAMRILRNAADADDAVQTSLLRGWTRRFFLRSPDKLAGWMCRIVINESYNLIRKRQRDGGVELDEVPEVQLNAGNEDSRSEEREEQLVKMEKAIAALPELYRETVHIALLGNLETEEAAALLGCSANTLYHSECIRRSRCCGRP